MLHKFKYVLKRLRTIVNIGILKIILVKGGHGLENVRLNLFNVTFFMSHRASFVKHTNTIVRHAQKSFGITVKCGKSSRKLILTLKK
jgi:hypothetical protein